MGVIARHEGIDEGEDGYPVALDIERYTGTPYMQLYLEVRNDDVHDKTELFTFDLGQCTALFRSGERFVCGSEVRSLASRPENSSQKNVRWSHSRPRSPAGPVRR